MQQNSNKKLHALIFIIFGILTKQHHTFFNIRHLRCPSSCASNAACRPNLNGGNQFDISVLFHSCTVFCRHLCLLIFPARSFSAWQRVHQQAADCYFIHCFIYIAISLGPTGYPKDHRFECLFAFWSSRQHRCPSFDFDDVAALCGIHGQQQLPLLRKASSSSSTHRSFCHSFDLYCSPGYAAAAQPGTGRSRYPGL